MQEQPVVVFENVSFAYHYQGQQVLNNISFTAFKGEFLGLIGPNGGGKTTLLKLILGFLQPDSGKISVLGGAPSAVRNQIAYVPQAIRFDRQFPISVMELVLLGRLSHLPWYGRYRDEDVQKAIKVLERVGLSAYRDNPFGTLSGGQAQRALIARALVSDPKLLLLDEPTASVDLQAEADIYALLKELQGTMTMMMVTHDLSAIIREVHRVLCVQREVYPLKPQDVCEHYALGLYHPPLIKVKGQ